MDNEILSEIFGREVVHHEANGHPLYVKVYFSRPLDEAKSDVIATAKVVEYIEKQKNPAAI